MLISYKEDIFNLYFIPSVEDQVNSWASIEECYDKATKLFSSMKTNDSAKEALKKSHANCSTGCLNCDLYFYCAGNYDANRCKSSMLSILGIGDKVQTMECLNLCIEEAYCRGTQESYDAKQTGKSAASIDDCISYLEPEGCKFDPKEASKNRAVTNENKVCYGKR